jgi:hypothetical protein
MLRPLKLLGLAATLLCFTACAKPIDLTGTWVGFRTIEAAPGADPAMTKTLSKVEIQITPNRKFALFERGLPKTGRVRYSSESAELEITELLGRPLNRQPKSVQEEYGPITLTPKSDGTLLYHDPKVPEPPLILKRQAK